MPTSLTISYSSVIRVIAVLLGLVFLYLVRDILIILFLSFVLAAAFDPWVSWFERRNLPRGFGILAVYLLLFAIISIAVVLIVPALIAQARILGMILPDYYNRIVDSIGAGAGYTETITQQAVQTFSDAVHAIVSGIIPAVQGIFGGSLTFFLIMVLTFYLSVDDRGLKRFFRSTLPVDYQPYFTRMANRIQHKMGLWFRGQLFLSIAVFIITAISLSVLHLITGKLPFWLILSVIAGIFEIVPFIGPFIAGAVAVVFSLSASLPIAGLVGLIYIVIQQLENNILVPKIMQKTVGLNPLVVILVILIGGRLAGILGAIISIPLAAAIQVFFKDIMEHSKHRTHSSEPSASTE